MAVQEVNAQLEELLSSKFVRRKELGMGYQPDAIPISPSAYDDEFNSSTLNAKWTAVNTATRVAPLTLIEALEASYYSLSTFPGHLTVMPNKLNTTAYFHQVITPASTCKIILKCSLNTIGSVFLCLASDNTFNSANNYFYIANHGTGSHRVGANPATAINEWYTAATSGNYVEHWHYLMIQKTTSTYTGWASNDGISWSPWRDSGSPIAYSFVNANQMTYLTIAVSAPIAVGDWNHYNPLASIDYVRYFANNTPTCNA